MIGCDFQYRDKIPVAVLGATGSVGQKFVQLLSRHPWFEIKVLAASERSAGKPYGQCVQWQMPEPLKPEIAALNVQRCEPGFTASVVFSGLDASVAGEAETAFADAGYIVISNSKNHRMDPDVPLMIPEVNGDHLQLLASQTLRKGKILTNPNCSVIGLAMALKPLEEAFGIESAHVVTLQAISGAGFSARKGLDIEDNVIPFIKGEEEKVETELSKILGRYDDGVIKPAPFPVSAQCNRVPVSDGHMACVSVKLKHAADEVSVIASWEKFSSKPQEMKLPSAPLHPVHYFREEDYPQTRLHRDLEKGMAVSVGRLRKCATHDYKFVALSHNTVRGAAGCSILIAETLAKEGLIFW